jgi:hypothetical protein
MQGGTKETKRLPLAHLTRWHATKHCSTPDPCRVLDHLVELPRLSGTQQLR